MLGDRSDRRFVSVGLEIAFKGLVDLVHGSVGFQRLPGEMFTQ